MRLGFGRGRSRGARVQETGNWVRISQKSLIPHSNMEEHGTVYAHQWKVAYMQRRSLRTREDGRNSKDQREAIEVCVGHENGIVAVCPVGCEAARWR